MIYRSFVVVFLNEVLSKFFLSSPICSSIIFFETRHHPLKGDQELLSFSNTLKKRPAVYVLSCGKGSQK